MIRRIKQPELFLDLAAALPQYNFVMVGGPSLREEELYRNIKYRADTLSNLTFTGFVPYKAIDDFFQRALLFVNTSESEGFPNAFLQAWSHCVPTVSFVDSGARLPNGKSVGLQVPTIDVMIETISHLMRAEKERKALGFRSREYVEQKHAPDVVLQMYEQLFNELLAR